MTKVSSAAELAESTSMYHAFVTCVPARAHRCHRPVSRQLIADAHRDGAAYGPEHPDTLTARHALAFWTGETGDTPSDAS